MDAVWFEIAVILVLVLANGVFSMSEIAVVASRKIRLQHRAQEGDRRARAALALAEAPAQFLSTVQVGITLIGILSGAYGGAMLSGPLAAVLDDIPAVARYAEGLAFILVVAAITLLSLVFGELVPKNIGLHYPESIASWVAGPMRVLSRIGGPVVNALTGATTLILRVFGLTGASEPALTEDEIRAVIRQGAQTGALEAEEESIVQRVFQLGDQRVAGIMTPRVDIEWVDLETSAAELRDFLASHSHTEFVLCEGGLDNVLGTVRAAELLPALLSGGHIDLRSLMREPLFVPDSMRAFRLLEAFRASHRHVALVMDEFGAVEGLVTVGDLLEALVGELPEDASEAVGAFVERSDGSWLVEGSAPIEEVATRFELDVPEEETGSYHTMGGFVLARLGHIPKTAESFEWSGVRFEVVDMDGRRIDKVMVNRVTSPQSPATAPP
jgi:putative hemolysin